MTPCTKPGKQAKTYMLRSIAKQSGESAESVLEKKREATVGRFGRKKEGLHERVRG